MIVAANRDEFYGRPSTKPQKHNSFYAGIDRKAGGSWMGVTQDGFIVGITNQRTAEPPKAQLRSRGDLVLKALQMAQTSKVLQLLEKPTQTNAFNLLFGRANDLYIAYGHDPYLPPTIEKLPSGLHVLPNGKCNDNRLWKVANTQKRIQPILRLPWPELKQRLFIELKNNQRATRPDPMPTWLSDWGLILSSLFVESPKYGTCSSTIISTKQNKLHEYWFAEHYPNHPQKSIFLPIFLGEQGGLR